MSMSRSVEGYQVTFLLMIFSLVHTRAYVQHVQTRAHLFLFMFSAILFLEPRFTCDGNSIKFFNFFSFLLDFVLPRFFLPRTLFNLQ